MGSQSPRFQVWASNLALGPSRGILGTLQGTYRVYSMYIRIPGLRAHGFNLRFENSYAGAPRYAFLGYKRLRIMYRIIRL